MAGFCYVYIDRDRSTYHQYSDMVHAYIIQWWHGGKVLLGSHTKGYTLMGLIQYTQTQVAQWQGFARFTEIGIPRYKWFQGLWPIAYKGGIVSLHIMLR